jgi:hypothetical protein
MKTIELNFMEMVGVIADITGTNPLLQKDIVDSEGKKGGLLNEKNITQGAKLDLRFALKKIKEKYDVIEENRLAMLEEAKGDKPNLEPNTQEYTKFLSEFNTIASQKYEITIKPINMEDSNVRAIISEFDYSYIIELLFDYEENYSSNVA